MTIRLLQTLLVCFYSCSFVVVFLFQFHRRIYKGIPLQLRGEVWSLLLDVPKMKEEMKDYYNVSFKDAE